MSHCWVKASPTSFQVVFSSATSSQSLQCASKSSCHLFFGWPRRQRPSAGTHFVDTFAQRSFCMGHTWPAQSHLSLAAFLPTLVMPVLERSVVFRILSDLRSVVFRITRIMRLLKEFMSSWIIRVTYHAITPAQFSSAPKKSFLNVCL